MKSLQKVQAATLLIVDFRPISVTILIKYRIGAVRDKFRSQGRCEILKCCTNKGDVRDLYCHTLIISPDSKKLMLNIP
jgi:hypothetical protein